MPEGVDEPLVSSTITVWGSAGGASGFGIGFSGWNPSTSGLPNLNLWNFDFIADGVWVDLSLLTLDGWVDIDGDGIIDSYIAYHDLGYESLITAFQQNQTSIVQSLNEADFEVSGAIVVNGISGNQTFDFNFSSDFLSGFLAGYSFWFNSSMTDQFGVGGSFPTFAVVDPTVLEDGEPFITVQGESDFGRWNWVTLHEVAHQLLAPAYDALYRSWFSREGASGALFEDSDEFQENEQYADALVDAIAEALGLEIQSNVTEPLPTNPFSVSGTGDVPLPIDPGTIDEPLPSDGWFLP